MITYKSVYLIAASKLLVLSSIVTTCSAVCCNDAIVFPAAPPPNPNANRTQLPAPINGCGKFKSQSRVKTPIIYHSGDGFMPFVVQLAYQSEAGLELLCTGTLITSQHVLTAASCIDQTLNLIRLGQVDRRDQHDGHIDRGVATTLIHPLYREPELQHNIAIVRLDQAVPLGPHIWPVCLPWLEPQRSMSFEGHNPFVVGWWSTSAEHDADTNRLLDRPHTVLPSCHRVAGTEQYLPTPGMICTDNWSHSHGPCIEEGSPLVQPQRTAPLEHRMFLTGVGSFGLDCEFDDDQRSPMGYTKVQDYVDWIAESL